jgi:KDO2-lipid IV(A) lauroyltransferase
MAKPRSRLADAAVYVAVRVAVALVQMLSWAKALELAKFLGWLAYRLDRRHRLVAADNVRHAFSDLSEGGVDRLVRATYRHWAMVAVEMIRLPRALRRSNLQEHFSFPDPATEASARQWAATTRRAILLTGHFGNFEALSYMLGLFGVCGAVVARRLDNPYLDRFLRRFRQKTGQELLDKRLDYPRILAALESGGGLGVVGDQDAGPRGLFVEFFGRPASTFKSVALLSLQYQAPILVEGAARVGWPLRYRLYFEDVILPEEYEGSADAARAITQRYTRALERMVRRHPEQYFWLHRRWKHQPKARAAKAA